MIEGEEAWTPLYEAVEFVEAKQCCHRERAIALVREALEAGQLRSRTVAGPPLWVVTRGPDGSERFHSDGGERIEVLREDVLQLWQEGKQPAVRKKAVPKRPKPVEEGILEAIRALWPNGIPRGLKAKQRDNQIHKWLKDNGRSVGKDPSPSLSRVVQRVLKAHPELLQ
jgi:hypothetical protein